MENTTDTAPTPTVPTARERLEKLEGQVANLEKFATGISQALNLVDKEFSNVKNATTNLARGLESVSELIASTLTVLGEETKTKVLDFVKELRAKNMAEKAEQARKTVKDALEKGSIVEADTINTDTLLVLSESDKEGNKIGVGYVPVWFGEINPDVASQLSSKTIGDTLDVPDGKVEILEIYHRAAPPAVPTSATEETPTTA
jgi:DNA-binding ferritin-like protein